MLNTTETGSKRYTAGTQYAAMRERVILHQSKFTFEGLKSSSAIITDFSIMISFRAAFDDID